MRPTDLEQYLGQDEITGSKSIWKPLIENNNIPSIILYGPPGCGKTR